jgi:hypothetical protein
MDSEIAGHIGWIWRDYRGPRLWYHTQSQVVFFISGKIKFSKDFTGENRH